MPTEDEVILNRMIAMVDQLETHLRGEKMELMRLLEDGNLKRDDYGRIGKCVKAVLLRMTIAEMQVEHIQGGIIPR